MNKLQALPSYLQTYSHPISVIAIMVIAMTFCFSFALFNVGMIVAGICLLIEYFKTRQLYYRDQVFEGLILFFFVASLFSLTQSQYFEMSMQGVNKLLRYLMVLFFAREIIRTERDMRWIVAAVVIGGVVASVDGILQYLLGVDPLRGRTPSVAFGNLIRISSSFPNPNAFVIYLGFVIPITYATVAYGKLYKFWGWIALALMLIAMALTYSRTGALCLGVAAIFFIVIKRDKFILTGLILALILMLLILPENLRAWFLHLDSWKDFFLDESRRFHHQTAWNMFKSSPWVGVGINTFDVNYGAFKVAADPTTRWSAHQAYLQMLAEVGVVGFSGFVLLMVALLSRWWKALRQASNREHEAILLGFAGALFAFLTACLFESCLWQPRQTFYFWSFTGIFCSVTYYMSSKARKTS